MHRGPEVGPYRVRIEAGQMWVAPARIFWEDFERRESIYVLWTCGLQYRMLRRVGGDARACPCDKKQNPTPSTKDEAPLNCVALRPPLDYEVAWRAVKGRDERQRTAPWTVLHATGRSVVDVGENNKDGRHVGLDFYDLLIEVIWGCNTNHQVSIESSTMTLWWIVRS